MKPKIAGEIEEKSKIIHDVLAALQNDPSFMKILAEAPASKTTTDSK
jgi:hypothetical protein